MLSQFPNGKSLIVPLNGLEPNPTVIGQNVATARKRRSLNQAHLAQRLGVSRPTLIAIETGQRAPTPTLLAAISHELNTSIQDLTSLVPADEQAVIRFRDPLRTNEPARQAIDALIDFGRYFALLEVKTNRRRRPRVAPALALDDTVDINHAAEDLAASERARLNLGDGPLTDIRLVLEQEVGVLTFGLPQLSNTKIVGLFVYADERGLIGINLRQADRRRQNWTIAHEYAHFLTNRYDPEVTLKIETKKARDRYEQFAEIFTASFLMPAFGLSRRFSEMLGGIPQATAGHILLLASQYHVSFHAMCRRLESMERIPKNTYDYLISKGLKPIEAERAMGIERQDESLDPYPLSYVYLLSVLKRKGELSEGDVAHYLQTDRLTAREVIDALDIEDAFPIDEPLQRLS